MQSGDVIVEDAQFTTEEADELGYAIARKIAANRLWPAGIRLRSEPLAPWQSRARSFDDGPRAPWQVEAQPRLDMRLRVDRHDIFGDEVRTKNSPRVSLRRGVKSRRSSHNHSHTATPA